MTNWQGLQSNKTHTAKACSNLGLLISVIITSYSLSRLQEAKDVLRSISAQTTRNFEVVYVTERDHRLFDAIEQEVKMYDFKAVAIHNEGAPGLAEARNLGVSQASGDIVAFVDDDVVLSKGWTDAVERAFETFPRTVGITGPAYPLWMGKKREWLPVELDWLIGSTRWFGSDRVVEVRNCWGMNMAFRRNELEEAGGFSVETGYHRGKMAEDVELSLRLRAKTRMRILYVPRMLVWNKVNDYRLSNRFIMERSRWIGYSRRYIRESVRTINPGGADFDNKVLLGIVKSFVKPVNTARPSFADVIEKYRALLLVTACLLVGYLVGPMDLA